MLERFFDESGGMQLVLHAPFGSRINRAWGLALRKRFCRQFDFELQAAATEDAVLLSLGPQHSFPLADVFRYLHPATARDVLVQALLDAPVSRRAGDGTRRSRWPCRATATARRSRRSCSALADDLMAAVFPDAAACLENIAGDREIPDHPLVNQAVRDCLEEAMDFDGSSVLTRIHADELRLVARDTPSRRRSSTRSSTPSRTRSSTSAAGGAPHAGGLHPPRRRRLRRRPRRARPGGHRARARRRRPDPRDADELHDALLTAGFLTGRKRRIDRGLFDELVARATRCDAASIGSGSPPNVFRSSWPSSILDAPITAPPSRAASHGRAKRRSSSCSAAA